MDNDLWEAYRQTKFWADIPLGVTCILVGEIQPALDHLLQTLGTREWAFITAYNPASALQEAGANQKRHQQLVKLVEATGYRYFPGRGIGTDPGWEPEESLLILGVCREEAILLGRQFGQNAIVCGSFGQPAELVGCDSA